MEELELRWKQRLENLNKAFLLLEDAVQLSKQRKLSKLEEQGLIQGFEFTHELAWNVLKDYLQYQGNSSITGSRDATREAFQSGIIADGEGWMDMIRSRNQSSHTYNEAVAEDLRDKITDHYFNLFVEFNLKMNQLK